MTGARSSGAALAALVVVLAGGVATGCGSSRSDRGQAPAAPAAATAGARPRSNGPRPSLVARARRGLVRVYRSPGTGPVARVLANPNPDGAPLVFLVRSTRPGWLRVYLPVRPDGATGWIHRRDVTLASDPYRVRVELRRHVIVVRRGSALVDREPVGVGHAVTPTPLGTYYLTELIEPPDRGGFYGPYAFGLSAYSPVLTTFAGGSGEIGIHGTNDPAGLGRDVSHGCIRMSNAGARKLARVLPLGTPVTISR